MRLACICAILLVIPAIGAAKSETARIEILHGKRPFVTLAGADTAGQFTIWSGPGTVVTAEDGTESTPAHPGDIANWEAGAVQLPRDVKMYKVRFYCAAGEAPAREAGPSHLCYGVRYAIVARWPGIHPDSRGAATRTSRATRSLSTAASRAAGSALRPAGKHWSGRASTRHSRPIRRQPMNTSSPSTCRRGPRWVPVRPLRQH